MKEKIETSFVFHPSDEKYEDLINKLISEGWNYVFRKIVGYDKNNKPNLVRVFLERYV